MIRNCYLQPQIETGKTCRYRYFQASVHKGVTIDKLASQYYKVRYVTGLRILSENANS
jgi:hypothetical protein